MNEKRSLLNGDRWVLIDFFISSVKLAIEVDGSSHENQARYDRQRSEWLARKHGMHVARFTNAEAVNGEAEQRLRQILGFNQK
jgi:very-short-patch-repair endonuclease